MLNYLERKRCRRSTRAEERSALNIYEHTWSAAKQRFSQQATGLGSMSVVAGI